jgi:hypothetical protein
MDITLGAAFCTPTDGDSASTAFGQISEQVPPTACNRSRSGSHSGEVLVPCTN